MCSKEGGRGRGGEDVGVGRKSVCRFLLITEGIPERDPGTGSLVIQNRIMQKVPGLRTRPLSQEGIFQILLPLLVHQEKAYYI